MNTTTPILTPHTDLIYDVGFHKGEDTSFYLTKGFRVVAFEANPALVDHGRQKFATEIATGRLVLVEGAVIERIPGQPFPASLPFFFHPTFSAVGSLEQRWTQVHLPRGSGKPEQANVPTVDFAACLQKYGVPYYLKIDIEGSGLACVRSLATLPHRPHYLSLEASREGPQVFAEEIALLEGLGYLLFQLVQQVGIRRQQEPQPAREGQHSGKPVVEGSSGLFGRDLPNRWQDGPAIIKQQANHHQRLRLVQPIVRLRGGGRLIRIVNRLTGYALGGYLDTHARHQLLG
jgi:FkbM family methyltransferase